MRIIAGIYKGRKIEFPPHIRPTQDKVRQAIFNTLGQDFEGLSVLDLFAGSGAMGLEALSRGAKRVVFVDIERKCNFLIGRNLENLGISGKSSVQIENYRQDVFRAIEIASKRELSFDVVFADPPYGKDLAKKLLKTGALSDILPPHGLLVVEHSFQDALDFDSSASSLEFFRESRYGKIKVAYLRKK
jgi:16S rRNA (guanine(966)-N(2))-methyltransferase RsmD